MIHRLPLRPAARAPARAAAVILLGIGLGCQPAKEEASTAQKEAPAPAPAAEFSDVKVEGYPAPELLVDPRNRKLIPVRTEGRVELIPDGEKTTLIYEPIRARSEVMLQALKGFVSLDGRISASPELNTLLVWDRADRMESLTQMIRSLDRTPPQLLVEARVLEITLSDDFEFDVKETFTQLAGAGQFVQAGEIELKTPGPSPLTDQGLSLTLRPLSSDSETLDIQLRILFKEGRAKILSAPSQVVEVGHTANLITGEEVPIFKSTVTGGSTTVSTDFKPVGVKLQVTPLRVAGDTIELEVKPEVSAVTGFSAGPEGSSAPIIASRQTRTTLRLKDGQILSIAGLMRTEDLKDVHKIPWFADLPYIGFLFQSIRDRNVRTQLVFLLRVHILDEGNPWTIRLHESGTGLEELDDALEGRVHRLKIEADRKEREKEQPQP